MGSEGRTETKMPDIFAEALADLDLSNVRELSGTERERLQPPDLSSGIPVQLWEYLGIPRERRELLDKKAFLTTETHPLSLRLQILTEGTLRGLKVHTPGFTQGLIDSIYGQLPDYPHGDRAIYGAVLAFEAYQVASDYDLAAGFAGFTQDDADAIIANLPPKVWWGKPVAQKMYEWQEPDVKYAGLFRDVRHIGRYAIQDDLAMGLTAVVMADFIGKNWDTIFRPDNLSPYQPGPYADPHGGEPIIR